MGGFIRRMQDRRAQKTHTPAAAHAKIEAPPAVVIPAHNFGKVPEVPQPHGGQVGNNSQSSHPFKLFLIPDTTNLSVEIGSHIRTDLDEIVPVGGPVQCPPIGGIIYVKAKVTGVYGEIESVSLMAGAKWKEWPSPIETNNSGDQVGIYMLLGQVVALNSPHSSSVILTDRKVIQLWHTYASVAITATYGFASYEILPSGGGLFE
jgi:hypothetical protein